MADPKRILEIGCGNGSNLSKLAKEFKNARFVGMDSSEVKLHRAYYRLRALRPDRVRLLRSDFSIDLIKEEPKFDLVLCSYALSKMDRNRLESIRKISQCLKPGGLFLALDYFETPFTSIRNWLQKKRIQIDPRILMDCVSELRPVVFQKHQAYGGLWTYFMFMGNPVVRKYHLSTKFLLESELSRPLHQV
jgi:S-adenosylmethionine-diacylgycerolhomoserine-N-methlytransferase